MKAIAKCPKCKKDIFTNCLACVSEGIDEHHDCKEDLVENVKWKVVTCTKEEAKNLERLGFKGEIPEILD